MASHGVSRRQLLEIALAGVALAGCGSEPSATPGGTGTSGGATGAGGGGADGATSTSNGPGGGGVGGGGENCPVVDPTCDETLENPLGPYHRPNAPFTTILDNPKGTGEPLLISGVVYASDCVTPLAGAVVEVWQADADGDYDNEAGDPGPSVWILRASIQADACGRYAYETIKPGRYLNGAQYRPSHIHYRVTHPAIAPYVTQLYFVGDPYNDVDSMFDDSLAIPLKVEGGSLVGVFDIFLAAL